MPLISSMTAAVEDIRRHFSDLKQRVFRRSDIERILEMNAAGWNLAKSTTTDRFLKFLILQTDLREERILFSYRPVLRYTWGRVGTWSIVQSINEQGYFSHYSAVRFHGLTEQLPKSVYFNQEQSLSGGGGVLSQQGLDQAFRGKCRVTSNTATFRDDAIFLLNGKNTGRLGVVSATTSDGEGIQVTSIERTLIDIVVRPIYSGGIFEVAKAFVRAHGQFSVNTLVALLRQLNFTYPYHQTIGYLMDRSGLYKESQLELLRRLPVEYDFYLDYGLKSRDYDPKWRLYIPRGF